MSKKILFETTIYKIDESIYSRVFKKYDSNQKKYILQKKVSKKKESLDSNTFYNLVQTYKLDVMNEKKNNTFTSLNAVFSISEDNKKKKIEKNSSSGEYYQVKYISESIRNKSQENFKRNRKNIRLSRRNIESAINKSSNQLKNIIIEDISIECFLHDKNIDYKNKKDNTDFITYTILKSEQIDMYNQMITLMYQVNENTRKIIDIFYDQAKNKLKRFSDDKVLQQFLAENVKNKNVNLYGSWLELINYVNDNNLVYEAQKFVKREKREAFKYIFQCSPVSLLENINQILFSILKELNARSSHDISKDKEKWIKTNIDNDKHVTIFPTDVFIKEYLENNDENWMLFEEVFAQFDLQKFIDESIYKEYKINILGNTKLFKKFNEHYQLRFEKEFSDKNKKKLQTTRTEMIRFIYRYLKGRVEKSVQTGQIEHWDVEQIKTKTYRAMQNKILERLLYLGKVTHGNLHPNVNEFQKFHAYEELKNEFYVLYSFFNSSMMTFINEKQPDKKEFFDYSYNKFTNDKNHINFSIFEIFKDEETYSLFRNNVKALRNYSLHNNINELNEVLQNSKLQSEYQTLQCLIEKIQIQDSTKSNALNLDIIFKGQNNKYKEIIKEVNSHIENNKRNITETHVYPSISPFIKDLKQEFLLPKNMNDENKVIIEQALIYLLKTIYKTDIHTGYFQIDNIEEKYRIAQRKASQSQTTKMIKSFQKYIFNQFVTHVKTTYPDIFNFENNIDFKQEIENKTRFDSTFELQTLNFDFVIKDDLDYVITIMGLLSHPRITSQFANRCIATAEWIKDQSPGKIINYNKLIDIAENLKAVLEIQGSWNAEELRLCTDVSNLSKKVHFDAEDIKYLPYELEEKQEIIKIGVSCFSLDVKFNLSFNPQKYEGNKKNIQTIYTFTKKLNQKYNLERYKKYQENLSKYTDFVSTNQNQISKIQIANNLNGTYMQEDEKTIVYHRSIIEALNLQTFDETNLLLKHLNLDQIKILEMHSELDDADIEGVQYWLRSSRIKGKNPIVKNLMVQAFQNNVTYNENVELFHDYEMYHFRKNIITYTIHKKLNENIIDIQAKWLQWIARFERDLHYTVKGLDKIYPNFIISTKSGKSRPISIDNQGKLIMNEMHYEIAESYNVLKFLDKLGFINAIEELKKEKEKNVRNYIAHLTFLHEPFDCSLIEVTQNLSNLMNYRSVYNTAVEKSILNIFKREVETPCIKSNKFINLDKIEKLIKPKQKTQFLIEDQTGMEQLIIELLKWKRKQ